MASWFVPPSSFPSDSSPSSSRTRSIRPTLTRRHPCRLSPVTTSTGTDVLSSRLPRGTHMTDTLSQRSVTFAHPFSLDGVDGTFPPGTYAVSESREQLEGLSFIGYRRTRTTIELPGSNAAYVSRQLVEVEPAELEAALARDARVDHGQP